jgi:hypothetical protein
MFASTGEKNFMVRGATQAAARFWGPLVLTVLLAACAREMGPEEQLSAFQVRRELSGHFLVGEDEGGRFFIQLQRGGVARYKGATAEFAQWTVGEDTGLCIVWFDRPAICAPISRINVSHYRWGKLVLNDLDTGEPGFFPNRHP